MSEATAGDVGRDQPAKPIPSASDLQCLSELAREAEDVCYELRCELSRYRLAAVAGIGEAGAAICAAEIGKAIAAVEWVALIVGDAAENADADAQ